MTIEKELERLNDLIETLDNFADKIGLEIAYYDCFPTLNWREEMIVNSLNEQYTDTISRLTDYEKERDNLLKAFTC